MSDDLLSSIRQNLTKTGFVTEMLVAAILRDAGWAVVDHAYYIDKDENKGREIDIVAVRTNDAETETKKLTVTLALSVEIKKVSNKPWVVFVSPKGSMDQLPDLFATSLVRMHIQEIWFQELYADHPISAMPCVGRVAYQALTEKRPGSGAKDEGYGLQTFAALVSCFKASDPLTALIRQGEHAQLRDAENRKTYGVGIVHGLIVLDGKLFAAEVRSREDIDLKQADHIPYIFNYASKEYGHRKMLVDIVTLDGLREYISKYDDWLRTRADFCLSRL